MNNLWKWAAAMSFSAALGFGSTVTGFSVDNSNPVQVTVNTFDVFGSTISGVVVSAAGGSCVWVASAGCTADNGAFSITYSDMNDQVYPSSGVDGSWEITNLTNSNISGFTFNAVAGGFGLDRCQTGPNTFADSNNNLFLLGPCLAEGTPGSNLGWTATSHPGGSNVSASVVYSDPLFVGNNPPVHDLYGIATFSFGSTFNAGETFTWRMDADSVNVASTATPEPATLGLVGCALLAAGAIRKRYRA